MLGEITVEARIENIEKVSRFVNERLEEIGCSMRAQTHINIALDELFSNICHYAYGDDVGVATIGVHELPAINAVQITLKDSGMPFDPLAKDDPDVTLDLQDRQVGGLGIFMVKKLMNDVTYDYIDGVNTLTVIKSL